MNEAQGGSASLDFLAGGGRLGGLIREYDWSLSPLGRPEGWPQSLRSVVGLLLNSEFPMFVAWGKDLGFLYNDAYAEILGAKHPGALGRSFRNVWSEIWPDISPLVDAAMAGKATYRENLPLVMRRRGYDEQTWFTFSYSAVRDELGQVAGMFCACQETTSQVVAERSVRAERDRAQGVLDNMGEAFVLLDSAFRIVDLNAEAMRLENRPKEAILGKTHWEAHPDAAPELGELYRLAMAERRAAALEHRYVWPDGRDTWIDMRAYPVVKDGLAVFYRDVTDRKRVEERLRELNETLEQQVAERTAERDSMWETSPDLMAVIDFDGVFRRVNPAWTTLLGYGFEELIGHHVNQFVLPVDHPSTIDAYHLAAAGGQPRIENRYRHKDGSIRWISWVAAPMGNVAYATGRDVTAEKTRQAELAAAEAARREADALYRAYFENTAEALFVVNVLPDGGFTVEDLNPAHQASIGLPLAEVAGRRIDEILPPELSAQVIAHYRHVLETGGVYQYREVFQLHGMATHWDTVLVPVRDGEGRIVRLIGSSRDLTGQMAAEEQLRQSQKMEAMGQLTGGVAHDFNNLLTPIVGSLDMLMRRGIGNERERRLIDGAMQSAERAKTLVQRLLAFARRQPLQTAPVDVARLVEGMAGLIGSTLGPTIDIRVELQPGLPPAQVDPNQLEMAILNLGVNARDAMPEGGALTIAASRESVRPGDRSGLRQGHYVRLAVSDTGVGMDEATRARAVEPFFSTKGVGQGTGLGLSMVHGLAAQLGGGLMITSAPGQGTTIEVWLPISLGPIGGEEEAAPHAPQARRRGRALLVDDEALVRMSTADMLIDMGFDVIEASSAEEALRLLGTGAAPDLLVTDHLMPGMSGAELAQEVRKVQPDLPILIVSGYAKSDGISPDLPLLTKPFRKAELAESVCSLFR